jgi:hypothetical protein
MKPLANPTSFDEAMRLIKEEAARNEADIAARRLEAELLFGRRYDPYEQYGKLLKRLQRPRVRGNRTG